MRRRFTLRDILSTEVTETTTALRKETCFKA